jgi:hypothetical protein
MHRFVLKVNYCAVLGAPGAPGMDGICMPLGIDGIPPGIDGIPPGIEGMLAAALLSAFPNCLQIAATDVVLALAI